MAKRKTARLADLVGLLNSLYAPALAEDWDNVGLQVGDPQAEIRRILISLDVDENTIEEAQNQSAQLVISHHPLLFRSLKRLTPNDECGRTLFRAVREGVAVYSLHTNLDRAADGLNDWLASRLGVENCQPVERAQSAGLYKLVVFVPRGHEQEVMDAMFAAGAGHIGEYDRVSFRTPGMGTFRASEKANPFLGKAGVVEEADEFRLETIIPAARLTRVVERMLTVHPYEEVAYDLILLANTRADIGLGRIGRLAEETSLGRFAELVRERLQASSLRLVGNLERSVSKVAVCGGSGASLIGEVLRQGADCLVTGDVKYHEAQWARSEGLAIIDAGHFATERIMATELSSRLRKTLAERELPVEVVEMVAEQDPFTQVC